MKQVKTTLLFAIFMASACGVAAAQDSPSTQSCGGLLCDMGILGHKVTPGPNGEPPSPAQVAAAEAADPHHLPCHDFFCRAFGGKEDVAAPPPPPAQPVAAAETEKPAPTAHKVKHKRVAKAATPEDAAAK